MDSLRDRIKEAIRKDLLNACSTWRHYEVIDDFLYDDVCEIADTIFGILDISAEKQNKTN